jgi:hypothetical protein
MQVRPVRTKVSRAIIGAQRPLHERKPVEAPPSPSLPLVVGALFTARPRIYASIILGQHGSDCIHISAIIGVQHPLHRQSLRSLPAQDSLTLVSAVGSAPPPQAKPAEPPRLSLAYARVCRRFSAPSTGKACGASPLKPRLRSCSPFANRPFAAGSISRLTRR